MMRFNHMELTLPRGTMTAEFRADVARFYGGVLGWRCNDTEILGQRALLLMLDERATQFILLAESDRYLSSPGYDHLGLLQPDRATVDALLDACKAYRRTDERLRLKEYEDLVNPSSTVHAFYVKYLLPIWFDVQVIEYAEEPARQWQWRAIATEAGAAPGAPVSAAR
jgi:hypothetical protein